MTEKEKFKHEQDHKSYDDDILEMIKFIVNHYSIKVLNWLGIEFNVINEQTYNITW